MVSARHTSARSARTTGGARRGPGSSRRAERAAPAARLSADELGNRVLGAPGRLEPLASALILTLLWWLGLNSLDGLIVRGPWADQALVICAATLVVPGLGRSALPHRPLLMVLAGLAAGTGAVVWAGRAGPYPEGWWADPSGTLGVIRLQISEGIPPILPSPALASLIMLACLLLSWSSAVLSAGGADGAATSALLPASALLLPSLFLSDSPPTTTLLAAGACLLGLILLSAPARYWPAGGHGPGHAHGPRGLRRLSAAAMTAVSLAVGAAAVAAAPSVPDHVWNPEGAASTVPDLSISLSQDLVRGSDAVALSYTGAERDQSLRLTLGVITDLGEGAWAPDSEVEEISVDQPRQDGAQAPLTAGGALSQSGLSGQEARDRLSPLTITTQGLRSDRLPTLQSTALVTDPVTAPDWLPPGAQAAVPDLSQWHWVRDSSTALAAEQPLNPGSTYSLLGWSAVADAEGRPRTPVPVPPAAPDSEALAAYTSLPGPVPQEVGALAREAVAQAGADRSSQAAALAARLRGPDFAYDESAPYDTENGASMEAIEAFLRERSGYCVHYASAFTVMARSLGIPTRIAVGYASRSAGPGQWTAVTGHQLHAWPEVWLDDAGWVAFEPTPGGAGLAADEGTPAQPSPQAAAVPGAEPTSGAAQSTPSAPPSEQADPTGAGPTPTASQAAPPPRDAGGSALAVAARALGGLAAALAVLAVLAAPAMFRRALRRRRIVRVRTGGRPAQAAWAELLATAHDLGVLTGAQDARAPTEEAQEEALVRGLAAARARPPGPAGASDPTGEPGPAGAAGPPGAAAPSGRSRPAPAPGRGADGPEGVERAVRSLREAVVAERYGPRGRGAARAEDLLTALDASICAMTAAVGRRRRLVAVVAPASLLLDRRGPGGPLRPVGRSAGRRDRLAAEL